MDKKSNEQLKTMKGQALINYRESTQNTLQRIGTGNDPFTDSNGQYFVSVFKKNKWDDKRAIFLLSRLKIAFPLLEEGFYDLLLERIKEIGYGIDRFEASVYNLIDNFKYPCPTIGNVLGFDKTVKLLTYEQVVDLCTGSGVKMENYKCVKMIGKKRYFASMHDIDAYGLEIIENN